MIRALIADLIGATAIAVMLMGGLFVAAFSQPVELHIEGQPGDGDQSRR